MNEIKACRDAERLLSMQRREVAQESQWERWGGEETPGGPAGADNAAGELDWVSDCEEDEGSAKQGGGGPSKGMWRVDGEEGWEEYDPVLWWAANAS